MSTKGAAASLCQPRRRLSSKGIRTCAASLSLVTSSVLSSLRACNLSPLKAPDARMLRGGERKGSDRGSWYREPTSAAIYHAGGFELRSWASRNQERPGTQEHSAVYLVARSQARLL